MTQDNTSSSGIRVWDPLVRLFHWSLVATFAIAFITEDDWLDLHLVAGYSVAALVAFRLLWGLSGTRYARFSQFVRPPSQVLTYLRQMLALRPPHHLGHNPAAGAMVIALLISLVLVSITGMATLAGEGQGPLVGTLLATVNSEWLEEIHEFSANLTLLLVMLHVAGVAVSSLLEGENLVRAMVTGRKRLHGEAVDGDGGVQ